jgi:hypothetical protein
MMVATAMPAGVAAQSRAAAAPDAANHEAIREHIDAAEDLVESLLDWRHVLTAVESADVPGPSTTLISVDREPVAKLAQVLAAIASMLPARTDPSATGPRGDLRAHVEKAREITGELLPGGEAAAASPSESAARRGPTRTGDITVDRTALERLEVEIDAIERVAPRTLHRN